MTAQCRDLEDALMEEIGALDLVDCRGIFLAWTKYIGPDAYRAHTQPHKFDFLFEQPFGRWHLTTSNWMPPDLNKTDRKAWRLSPRYANSKLVLDLGTLLCDAATPARAAYLATLRRLQQRLIRFFTRDSAYTIDFLVQPRRWKISAQFHITKKADCS